MSGRLENISSKAELNKSAELAPLAPSIFSSSVKDTRYHIKGMSPLGDSFLDEVRKKGEMIAVKDYGRGVIKSKTSDFLATCKTTLTAIAENLEEQGYSSKEASTHKKKGFLRRPEVPIESSSISRKSSVVVDSKGRSFPFEIKSLVKKTDDEISAIVPQEYIQSFQANWGGNNLKVSYDPTGEMQSVNIDYSRDEFPKDLLSHFDQLVPKSAFPASRLLHEEGLDSVSLRIDLGDNPTVAVTDNLHRDSSRSQIVVIPEHVVDGTELDKRADWFNTLLKSVLSNAVSQQ